jgi:hypothetical protein
MPKKGPETPKHLQGKTPEEITEYIMGGIVRGQPKGETIGEYFAKARREAARKEAALLQQRLDKGWIYLPHGVWIDPEGNQIEDIYPTVDAAERNKENWIEGEDGVLRPPSVAKDRIMKQSEGMLARNLARNVVPRVMIDQLERFKGDARLEPMDDLERLNREWRRRRDAAWKAKEAAEQEKLWTPW